MQLLRYTVFTTDTLIEIISALQTIFVLFILLFWQLQNLLRPQLQLMISPQQPAEHRVAYPTGCKITQNLI